MFPFLKKQYINFSNLPAELPLFTAPQRPLTVTQKCGSSLCPGISHILTRRPDLLCFCNRNSLCSRMIQYIPGPCGGGNREWCVTSVHFGTRASNLGSLSRCMTSDQSLCFFFSIYSPENMGIKIGLL